MIYDFIKNKEKNLISLKQIDRQECIKSFRIYDKNYKVDINY